MILELKEMMRDRRICKRFLQIIDESKRFWQVFEDDQYEEVYDQSGLDLFAEKSQDTMKCIKIKAYRLGNVDNFIETVKRSKASLQILHLDAQFSPEDRPKAGHLKYDLQYLVDLRLEDYQSDVRSCVILSNQSRNMDQLPGLKVLWDNTWLHVLDRKLLKNIVSLNVNEAHSSKSWRKILEVPSKSLKHLRIEVGNEGAHEKLTPLEFPLLKVFEFWSPDEFPSWIILPYRCTLVLSRWKLPSALPSISELWIEGEDGLENLEQRCPRLETLRVRSIPEYFQDMQNSLVSVMRRRREHVEAGLEVDRVAMRPISKILCSIRHFRDHQVEELRELVAEVLDVRSVSSLLIVEI